MKYGNVTLGQMEAAINKMGGIEMFQALLNGSAIVTQIKHIVDIAKSPKLPFGGAEVVKHESKINGKTEVELELVDDELFVDGMKITLHLSERQMGDKRIIGHELRKELESGESVLLNSNILDYIIDHPELFPEHWKKDENGETRYIFFWGTIFRNPSFDSLYVRGLCWSGGCLFQDYDWLDDGWNRQDPSAVLASI